MTCKANMTDSLAESESVQGAAIRENIEKNGVQVKKWSPEMLAAFKGAWQEALVDLRKDATFDAVWKDLSAFRKDYAYWSGLAFLPR